jgi:phosphoribosylpyrophosphate synthetase
MPELQRSGRHIIVDDICDGGGTFNLLAEAWKRKNPAYSKLELFVSHGIFSKGLDAIDPVIEHITTTDSWCKGNSYIRDRLTVLPLLPSFLKFAGLTP